MTFTQLINSPREIRSLLLAVAGLLALLAMPARCHAEAHGEAAEAEHVEIEPGGFKLGEFSVLNVHHAEGLKSKVLFTLYVEIEEGAEEEFAAAWGDCQRRFEDQVLTTVRMCELAEFQEADLHRFRRRLIVRLRRTLPELPLSDLYITDFRHFVM
jgi:hypothetical protein